MLTQKGDRLLGLAQTQLHNAVLEHVLDVVLADVGLALFHGVIVVASGHRRRLGATVSATVECVEYGRRRVC